MKLHLEDKVLYQLLRTCPTIALAIFKKYADEVRIRLAPPLINGISKVLKKLLRYFNGTIISIIVCSIISCLTCYFCLNLNDVLLLSSRKLIKLSVLFKTGSSLLCCHRLLEFFLSNSYYILLNYTLSSLHQCLYHYTLLYCLFRLRNQ